MVLLLSSKTISFADKTVGQKAGDLLEDQVKQSVSDARTAAISEIIGWIIGGAAKAFVGSQ